MVWIFRNSTTMLIKCIIYLTRRYSSLHHLNKFKNLCQIEILVFTINVQVHLPPTMTLSHLLLISTSCATKNTQHRNFPKLNMYLLKSSSQKNSIIHFLPFNFFVILEMLSQRLRHDKERNIRDCQEIWTHSHKWKKVNINIPKWILMVPNFWGKV